MRKTEKYQKTVEQERTIATYCDFCGKDIKKQTSGELEKELEALYEFDASGNAINADIEVKIRMSNSWHEMGESKYIELDVCPACFKNEILSRAKTSTVSNSDW